MRWWFAGWLLLCVWALLFAAGSAAAEQTRVHVVQKGQRLGSIAKRYQVSIAALCNANSLSRRDLIHPGQKLVIPERDDRGGSRAREASRSGKPIEVDGKADSSSRAHSAAAERREPLVHRVYKGQRLGSIAKRYHVSIDAICTANSIRRADPIRPGQLLLIPATDDPDGSRARAQRGRYVERHAEQRKRAKRAEQEPSWKDYSRLPHKKGYVILHGFRESWRGYVIGPGNRVLGGAKRAISRVLDAQQLPRGIDTRLISLLVRVSDEFGGRPIRVVSGYRRTSYSRESRHKVGRAVDFSIPGVPNSVLRDYLLTLPGVGVGYYPNSTFVHLDVRDRKTYWVDLAGPGEAPRYVEGQRREGDRPDG